ncbi:hypothetical protein ACFE04_025923 [Oxalis oulophora]
MERNRVLCTSVTYSDTNGGRMTLPKAWGYSSPALLESEIVLSLENGVSAAVKVKRGSSGNRMLYGELFKQFLLRHNIRHDFRMEFQNVGGNKYYVRIRDTQGVEIDYEIREVDNSRSYLSKNKGTAASMCKKFGEEEIAQGYLAVPTIWGNHYPDLYRGLVYLLVSDGRRWAIETEKFNDGTIRLFGEVFRKLMKHYGVRRDCRAIFDYTNTSSFHLMLTDWNGIEIEYEQYDEGGVQGVRKSNVPNRRDRRSLNGEEIVMAGYSDDSESMSDEVDGGEEIEVDGDSNDSESMSDEVDDGQEFELDGDSDDSESMPDEVDNNEVLVLDGDSDESDSVFDVVETGDDEMGNGKANSNDRSSRNIWYSRGYLLGGNFGRHGSPGFIKKMTEPICTRFQPMYIPRCFVRTQLLPRRKSKVARMLVGQGVEVECNIRWGGVSNSDDAYITSGLTLLMHTLKAVVGNYVMFRLVHTDADANSVTFEVTKMKQ